eukprot:7724479-Pyramimonas_sp.AAC.1
MMGLPPRTCWMPALSARRVRCAAGRSFVMSARAGVPRSAGVAGAGMPGAPGVTSGSTGVP